MPMVTIEMVGDTTISPGELQLLTDELGRVLGSRPGGTWVRLQYLPRDQYAENESELDPGLQPTFVEILKRRLPPEPILQLEANSVAVAVAAALGRAQDNVHVIYLPEGVGRVAFGGELLSAQDP